MLRFLKLHLAAADGFRLPGTPGHRQASAHAAPGGDEATTRVDATFLGAIATVCEQLAASGLNAHVTGSTGAASADTIYIESAGVLNSYFYKTGGLGGVGWRLTSAPTGADQGGVVLTPGKAILFREQAGSVGFALPEPFAE
jgi:hypothetical protein